MTVRISRTGRVVCLARIELPMSSGKAWGQLRDLRLSAMHDPFHASIKIEGNVPRPGARLRIVHRYVFWQSVRVGRILRWQEGTGFAFSDLSARGRSAAFPHVVSYRLQAVSAERSQLKIFVGGRWTARVPRWVGRIWLWWVFSHLAHSAENELLRFALAIKLRQKI